MFWFVRENWEPLPTLSPECCSVPETQQTGDRAQSWVYLPGQCVLNTKNRFDLVDVMQTFITQAWIPFGQDLRKLELGVMIRSLQGHRANSCSVGCTSCPWPCFYVQKFISLSEKMCSWISLYLLKMQGVQTISNHGLTLELNEFSGVKAPERRGGFVFLVHSYFCGVLVWVFFF